MQRRPNVSSTGAGARMNKEKKVEKRGNHREKNIKQGEERKIENSPVESSPGDPAILKTSRSGN
jgi:hypothetical protein